MTGLDRLEPLPGLGITAQIPVVLDLPPLLNQTGVRLQHSAPADSHSRGSIPAISQAVQIDGFQVWEWF
jgi:hypothetical protein